MRRIRGNKSPFNFLMRYNTIDININQNSINRDLFITHPYNYKVIYKCVICDKEMTLNSMMSNLGNNAICMTCVRNKFGSRDIARKWIDGRNVRDEILHGRK